MACAVASVALTARMPLSAQQPGRSDAQAVSVLRTDLSPADSSQTRGVDAELRIALFDLAAGRPLTALNRLEWLRSSDVAAVLDTSRGGASAASARGRGSAALGRSRADLLFLLAESYNRLGMTGSFRDAALALAQTPGGDRYASVVGSQLMLDAYRRGDYSRVRELARSVTSGSRADRAPLADLLEGLAAYQVSDFPGARTAFARVRAEGGVYAPYAQLMDALAQMGGDTTRALEALGALRSLAQVATGPFGDHVRLIAAELAYESGQYASAVANARGVGSGTGLAPQALLTQGWSLYRDGDLAAARAAFADFAAKYPLLPERDEARLMAGQAMLEGGDATGAERYFQAMADSVAMEASALQSQAPSLLTQGASTLVKARAAGIAFLSFPRDGKTLAFADGAGGDVSAMLAAFAGTEAPPPRNGPHIVSMADIEQRLRTARPELDAAFPRRLLYAPAGKDAAQSYAARAQKLADADVRVALANFDVSEQVEANKMKIAALEELQLLVALHEKRLASDASVISATRDSLAAMRTALAQGRARVRQAVLMRVAETQRRAAANRSMIDSVRRSIEASGNATDGETLETEAHTAATFDQLAALVRNGLDTLVERHPVFALADSIAHRVQAADALHGEVRSVLAADSAVAAQALAGLRAGESRRTTAARSA
ncbi:MAG TPA: tetratricopeptide repeat protein, partial [Gemmatimonadaceae bacterium]